MAERDAPPATKTRRDEIIAVVMKYLESIITHDPSDVPFSEHAWRVEQGVSHGATPDEIREGLRSSIMDVCLALRPVRWIIEEDTGQAVAFYEVDLVGGATCHLGERFLVRDGLIEEIEAVFVITPGPDAPGA